MNIRKLHRQADAHGHILELVTYSGHYQHWRCNRCDAALAYCTTPGKEYVKGRAHLQCCLKPARSAEKQPVLFDETASDDWGDSADLRTMQKRLL